MSHTTCPAQDSDRLPSLLLQAKTGDAQASEELFRLLAPWVFLLAFRRIRHRADAEDITQRVLLTLWVNLAKFDPAKGNGRPWLFRILMNEISSHGRRQSRFRPLHLDRPSTRDDPLAVAEANDTLLHLENAIAKLDPDLSTALRLRYDDEMTFQQLADTTNLPLGTAAGRVYRGLSRLRCSLRPAA